jgi:O-antigen ligase
MFYFYHKLRGKSELIEYSVVLSGFILSIYYVANFFYAASNHGFGNVLFDRVTGGLASLPWGASNVVAGCIVITYVVLTNIRSVKFSNVMFLSFVFFLGIAVTFSKTGIVLFFVLFLSFIVSKKKVGLSSLLSVIVFIVSFLVVMFYAFSSHLDALSDLVTQRSDFEDLASGNGRFNIWYQALMHFASSPLQPVGYYGSIYHFGHSSHNYYITLLLEQGVIPFFLHVIFFLVLFLKSIALSRLHVVGFIVILINLVFEDVNFVHPYMFYFSFYILILAMKKNDRYIRYYS